MEIIVKVVGSYMYIYKKATPKSSLPCHVIHFHPIPFLKPGRLIGVPLSGPPRLTTSAAWALERLPASVRYNVRWHPEVLTRARLKRGSSFAKRAPCGPLKTDVAAPPGPRRSRAAFCLPLKWSGWAHLPAGAKSTTDSAKSEVSPGHGSGRSTF